jgi:hypothetical protein
MSSVTSTSAVAGLSREPEGVVEENLVGSGLDDQGRQAGQVGEDGADEAESGVTSRRIVGDSGSEGFEAQQRVDLALGFHRRPGQGEIDIRRHDQGRGRQGQLVIAGVDQGGDGESAARRLAREGDVRRGDTVVQKSAIGRESVVDRCRIRVLGGESVVDGDDFGVRPPADLRGQVGGEESVPHHVDAAVEVQDDLARFDPVHGDLGRRNATQRGSVHGHVGRQRLRRQQLFQQSPLLLDIAVGGEGRLSQDRIEGLSLLGGHGGSPFVAAASAALMGAPAGRSRG